MLRTTFCLALLTVAVGACSPEPVDEATDLGAVSSDSLVDPSTTALDARPPAEATGPFAGFDLPASGEAATERRSVQLLLRNAGAGLALVYADGGAGEVFLDSVPAGEDHRVNVQTRAGLISLRSETADGVALRRTEVTPGMPTVYEVIVADSPRTP